MDAQWKKTIGQRFILIGHSYTKDRPMDKYAWPLLLVRWQLDLKQWPLFYSHWPMLARLWAKDDYRMAIQWGRLGQGFKRLAQVFDEFPVC